MGGPSLELARDGAIGVELATCVLGVPCSGLLCRGLPRRVAFPCIGRSKRPSEPAFAPPRSSRKLGFAFLWSTGVEPPGPPKRTFGMQAGLTSLRQSRGRPLARPAIDLSRRRRLKLSPGPTVEGAEAVALRRWLSNAPVGHWGRPVFGGTCEVPPGCRACVEASALLHQRFGGCATQTAEASERPAAEPGNGGRRSNSPEV